MKTLKILLILAVILSLCTEVSALGGKRNRGKINTKKVEEVEMKMNEPDLNLESFPFSKIVDWRYEENRQNYKDLLKKAGYTIETYEIRYINNNGEKIENIWYGKEFFYIIKKNNAVVGNIWMMSDLTIPGLIYKLESDLEFGELAFIYSKTNRYEMLKSSNGKQIELSYFDIINLGFWREFVAPTKYEADIKKEFLKRNYIRTESLKEVLDYGQKHRQKILTLWKTKKLHEITWVEFLQEDQVKYKEIQRMIMADVKKYGGDDWRKKWKDIQEKWPSMRDVK